MGASHEKEKAAMRGLILLDWDNTLVDNSLEEHEAPWRDARLMRELHAKIEQGWVVGLNSDTPLRRLQRWWKSLALNGPIIAERGGVIWWPESQPVLLSATVDMFADLLQTILQTLSRSRSHALYFGDSTQFVESVGRILGDDESLVVLDAYRLSSVGMFVRRIRNGETAIDVALARQVLQELEPLRPVHPLVSGFDLFEPQCFVSLSALDVDKTRGLRALLNRWARPAEIVMIGDSEADILGIPEVRHLAVANASDPFKAIVERVATRGFAAGCAELLAAL